MDDATKQRILAIMAAHRIMTVATLRPDGWPQATTVCGKRSARRASE